MNISPSTKWQIYPLTTYLSDRNLHHLGPHGHPRFQRNTATGGCRCMVQQGRACISTYLIFKTSVQNKAQLGWQFANFYLKCISRRIPYLRRMASFLLLGFYMERSQVSWRGLGPPFRFSVNRNHGNGFDGLRIGLSLILSSYFIHFFLTNLCGIKIDESACGCINIRFFTIRNTYDVRFIMKLILSQTLKGRTYF